MTRRRPAAVLTALALLAIPIRAAAEEARLPEARVRRPVTVAEVGWVRVPLDAVTLSGLAPDGADLRLIAPDGREVAYAWSDIATAAEERDVTMIGAEAGDGTARFVIDVGAGSAAHDRLSFQLAGTLLVAGVGLEASDDAATWVALADATLFRLGSDPRTAVTGIDYPKTTARYLRLTWPTTTELPPIERTWVRLTGNRPDDLRLSLRPLRASTDPRDDGDVGSAEVWFNVPSAGTVNGLDVRWSGGIAVGFTLDRAVQGAWTPTAEGVLQAGATPGAASLALPDGLIGGDYRLRVWDGTAVGPTLPSVSALMAPRWIDAYAEQPGTYSLAYGAIGLMPPRYATRSLPPDADVPIARVGAEEAVPGAPLPESALSVGAALSTAGFATLIAVEAEIALPGAIVWLELPERAYAYGIGDGLRLIHEGSQVPYLREAPPEPAVAASLLGQRPGPFLPRTSAVTLTVSAPRLPLAQIELVAPAQPFERDVTVQAPARRSPGQPATFDVLGSARWVCAGYAALPCRLTLPLAPIDATTLVVSLVDGDNPPLASLDARVYRRRDALRFPWPGEGVVLALGNPALREPHYDLALIADELMAHDAVIARVLDAGPPPAEAPPVARAPFDVERWVPVAALVVAGAALLAVLARTMGSDAPSDAGA